MSTAQSTKLVDGYIRSVKLSPQYQLFSCVPIGIHCIIEIYKSACDDKWDSQCSSKDITITQNVNANNSIIRMNKNHDSTAFGHNIICSS